MKLTDFLKDRLIAYLLYLTALAMIWIFMSAFRFSLQVILLISIILLLTVIFAETWEFLRKKSYYDKLLYCLNELDKKYLLLEMISKPDFYDGKILYEALYEANKSMCENVTAYRHESTEFREYIEMWVHEIKLPVASLQLMCHNDSRADYAEQLHRIDDDIENVLYYARSRNAEKDYIIKETSLKRVFADVAIRNREALQQKNITVRTENLDRYVLTDSKWLTYLLTQLIGNSIKYISPEREPEIYLYTEDKPDRIVLHFRDNGIGIPEHNLPYIFEKSFTGENGRTHAKSTGMGLYLVRKLCEKLGHSVRAESVQGEFTEIIISFGKNDFAKLSC